MNLTLAELAELPLPAALLDRHDDVIASTPEWDAAAPGAVAFPVRSARLVICPGDVQPSCEAALSRLLDALDETTHAVNAVQRLRVAMLAASLRIMAGRRVTTLGTSHDVVDHAVAGIRARTALGIRVDDRPATRVSAPEVAALVLVQLAANAERHAGASTVTLDHRDKAFHVRWRGRSGAAQVVTARRRDMRARWGMGFARIAADTLGGAVYPPFDDGDGMVVATLELGLNRLALPLAAIQGGRVLKATRAWDEETGCHPGMVVDHHPRVATAAQAAAASPGSIAISAGWWARARSDRVWIAIPPDDIVARARDVLDGILHERALWEGVPEPAESRIYALASLLAANLGAPLARVPGDTWNRKFSALATTFRLRPPLPAFAGIGAVDPRIAAYLASEFGTGFSFVDEEMFLRIREDKLGEPLLQRLLDGESGTIKLS